MGVGARRPGGSGTGSQGGPSGMQTPRLGVATRVGASRTLLPASDSGWAALRNAASALQTEW